MTATPSAPVPVTIHDPADPQARLSIRERLAYGAGDIGGNLVFAAVSAFLLFYLTDIAGIGAAIAGTLLLFGRVLDGTLDLVVGTLIDRTNTRWGKARPWILFSTPVLLLSFVLLFAVPQGLSSTGKEIYVFVMYVMCLGVGFVSSNLAYHTLLSVITANAKMRVSLTVLRSFAALVTSLVVNAVTLPLITSLGGGQPAWSTLTVIYAVIAAGTFLILFFGTKERIRTVARTKGDTAVPLGRRISMLVRNRYFFLVFALFFTVFVLQGTAGIGVYFAEDVLGDVNMYGLLSTSQILPMAIGLWFMPPLMARFGKRRVILVGISVAILASLLPLIDPSNLGLLLTGAMLRGFGTVPVMAGMFAIVADVVDYGEWRNGVRLDGMTYAAATAGQNFGAGLGIALVGWLLAAGNYDGLAEVQPESAIQMEIFLMIGMPLIASVLMGVISFLLDLDKHLPQAQRDLADRRVTAAASE